jgi:hypothetical protein
MAKPANVRAKLKKHYAFDRLSLDQAAKLCDVAYGTARRWKDKAAQEGDDWDKLRGAAELASGDSEDITRGALTELMIQFKSTLELIKGDEKISSVQRVQLLSSLMDNIQKGTSAMRRLLPETNELAVAMKVLRGMAEFVQKRFPQHGAAFIEILEPFGDELERLLGDGK